MENTLKSGKGRGRPKVEEYRLKKHRMGRIEDRFLSVLSKFDSSRDKRLVLEILEELKQA